MGVRLPGTIQAKNRIGIEAEVTRVERMLAAEDDQRRQPSLIESSGDGLEFDGFRTGADDQNNFGGTQPSPYLGGGKVPPLPKEFKPFSRQSQRKLSA